MRVLGGACATDPLVITLSWGGCARQQGGGKYALAASSVYLTTASSIFLYNILLLYFLDLGGLKLSMRLE